MKKIKQLMKKIVPATYKKIDDTYKLVLNELVDIKARTTPKSIIDYEVQLVEHCNLNCKGCSHFSPLCEEEFLDVKEYEKDCKRLSELFDAEANFIRLMGGEPLLHPEIEKFFYITRNNFPNAVIDLDTNGILVLSMKKEFWKAMSENKINLTITKYPIKIDYEKIKKKCEEENVTFRFFDEHLVREFIHLPLDLEGRGRIENNFFKCYLANSCHTLKHGKMYTCSTIPHVNHFNEYYKCNLCISKKDSIDIYKVNSGEEILEFFAKPVPFCRYCKVEDRKHGFKWDISQKDINEWT